MASGFSSVMRTLRSAWSHRSLVAALTAREIAARYKGSMLGVLWAVLLPLLMLGTYTLVFSVVFGARWPSLGGSKGEFALVLFAGLLVFNLFAECINRAPTLVLQNASYVKKVVFPLEVLPVVTLAAALFNAGLSYLVWQVFAFFVFGTPPWTVLLLPLLLLPVCLLTLGLSWMAAALGVYMRDLAQLTTVLTGALMFLSPIFYPTSALPASYQPLLALNPLAGVIEAVRNALLWGKLPDIWTYIVQLLGSAVIAWAGLGFFQRMRKGFADVL